MKRFRQIIWHILPSLVAFLMLLGIQLIASTVIAMVFLIDDAFEISSTWELIEVFALALFRSLLLCVILLFIGLALDRLTRNRPLWLRIVLPIPFILASGFLIYGFFISEGLLAEWFSSAGDVVVFLIALVTTFVPYWCILQIQRVFVWVARRARPTTIGRHAQ